VPSPLAVALMLAILGSIVGSWIWVILRLALGLPVLPPSTPRIVPWGAGSVLLTIVVWIALNTSVPIGYQLAIKHRWPAANAEGGAKAKIDLKPGEMMTLSAVGNLATLALIPLVLAATAGARPRDFGVEASGLGKQAVRGLVAYPLLAPLVFGVMGLAILIWPRDQHPLEKAIAQDRSPGMVFILVLAGAVLAPAAEELIFRGVMLGWLTRLALGSKKPEVQASTVEWIDEFLPGDGDPHLLETVEIDSPEEAPGSTTLETAEQAIFNPYTAPVASIAAVSPEPAAVETRPRAFPLLAANVAVSLVFAALHGAVWPTPIPIFFLSLGLGFLYQRTGGILAPIALHMTFNGVSTAMMFLVLGNNPDPKDIDPVPPPAHLLTHSGKIPTIRLVDSPSGFCYSFLPQR
jgi:membrane protease YdiL (CAAX protease family)